MQCLVCWKKKAEVNAWGNSYCKKCYLKSPYYAEIQAKKKLDVEKKEKQNRGV